MRWYSKMGVLTFVMGLALASLPVLSRAQIVTGGMDFRGRSYSAQDLAQALFAESTSGVQTRGVGAPEARPSLPVPRAAVTLNVLYPPNAETVPSISYTEIDKLGTVLSWPQYSDYRIQLGGHTDSLGMERKNQTLSEKRVQRIKEYIVHNFHVAPERVRAVGYGASRPIAPNDTIEGRSQNRRVEVVNLGRGQ